MNIRFATTSEVENWNKLLIKNPDGGNIFNSYQMTEFKRRTGWQPLFLVAENQKTNAKIFFAVQQKSIFGLGKFWYIAKGPGVKAEDLPQLKLALKEFARQQSVFVIKMETELLKTSENLDLLKQLDLPLSRPVQPNYSTILLDISREQDDIMANFPRGGAKYSINRARRDGVEIERVETSPQNAKIFYDLLLETGKDSGFRTRNFDYYFDFWRTFSEVGLGQMFFAKFEGQVVAAAFGLVLGEKSTYKDGASIRKRKAYGASHLIQWEVICWAQEQGAKIHDLCGTPPSDKISDKSHFLYGVGQFKASFSRQITDYVGCFDLIISNRKYKIWTKFIEKIITRFYRQILKKHWY